MGPLAQSVEQRTFNPWVVGSIPTGPTGLLSQLRLFSDRNLRILGVINAYEEIKSNSGDLISCVTSSENVALLQKQAFDAALKLEKQSTLLKRCESTLQYRVPHAKKA